MNVKQKTLDMRYSLIEIINKTIEYEDAVLANFTIIHSEINDVTYNTIISMITKINRQ